MRTSRGDGGGGSTITPTQPKLKNQIYVGNGRTAPVAAPIKKVVAKKPVSHVAAIKRVQAPIRPAYTASKPIKPAYSSGKSVGSGKTGRIAPVAPPKPAPVFTGKPQIAPTLPEYKDDTYMQQTNDAKKAMDDYMAQMTGQQNNYNTEYTRNLGGLGDQNTIDTNNISEEYAARGGIQSSPYLQAMADQATRYGKQQSDLSNGQSSYLSNLQAALQNFQGQQGVDANRYQQDAIQRRALKYNLA